MLVLVPIDGTVELSEIHILLKIKLDLTVSVLTALSQGGNLKLLNNL